MAEKTTAEELLDEIMRRTEGLPEAEQQEVYRVIVLDLVDLIGADVDFD